MGAALYSVCRRYSIQHTVCLKCYFTARSPGRDRGGVRSIIPSSTGAANHRIQVGEDEGKSEDENVGERQVENEDGG